MERQPQRQGPCAQGAPKLCLFREGETAQRLHGAQAGSGRKEICQALHVEKLELFPSCPSHDLLVCHVGRSIRNVL